MQSITTEHTARTEAKPRTIPMTNQAAIKLVDLLATSDAFREEFMRDARSALEAWSFDQHTLDWFWYDCKMGIAQLAPKATIAMAKDEIIAMLMAGTGQTSPTLDAGPAAKRRLID